MRRPVTAAVLLAFAVPVLAQETDRARMEALARRATERLQALQREADRLASDERTLLGDLRKLELDRQIRAETVRQLDAEAGEIRDAMAATGEQARQLERQEHAERPGLQGRLVEIYKLGRGRYLRLLLSTSDLRRVGQTSRMVAALARLDRERVASYRQTMADLQRTRRELGERDRQLASLREETERARVAVDRAAQARGDLIRDIDSRRDLNAQLAGELQSAQQKLQVALRDLASGVPATEPATLPLRPFRGDLDRPVAGAVRRGFGRAATGGATASNGVVFAADEGTTVRAIHEGVVAFAGAFAGFGNLVIVDHGARAFSLYGDLLEVEVKVGAHIDRGANIGSVGSPAAGPPGLYFELRVDGQPVDPLQWLRKK